MSPSGTIIRLATGTPARAGYTLLGTTAQNVVPPGLQNVIRTTFDLYRKNQSDTRSRAMSLVRLRSTSNAGDIV